MRTTIRLEDDLLRRAKAQAAAAGRSLNEFIADAVRAALRPHPPRTAATELPTYRGRGVQPGVDLDDSSGLLDLMDEAAGPAYLSMRTPRPGSSRRVAEKKRK